MLQKQTLTKDGVNWTLNRCDYDPEKGRCKELSLYYMDFGVVSRLLSFRSEVSST